MQHWDKSLIRKLLNKFEEDQDNNTHHFDPIFYNDRTGLVKYLKHMETKGYCTKFKQNGGYKWRLTDEGKDAKALLNTDCFIS